MQSTTDCIVPYKKKQQSGIFMDGDSKTILNCFARSVSIPKRFQNDFSIPNRFQNHFHYLLLKPNPKKPQSKNNNTFERGGFGRR